ncbi:MAG: protein kinase [Pirellulaceae bacterium]|nr:protein kinase [Pirellulaceae bacterium]
MNENQVTCDDAVLQDMLLSDPCSEPSEQLLAHIETCTRCQHKITDLAGSPALWDGVKAAISDADELDQHRRFPTVNLDQPAIHWTESMARQLLSPPTHPEMLGRLGRYEVERLIGSGGMGVVFKAFDTELNRPVAIKLLAPYLASSGPARKRFAREARAAAAVVHQHVVPIHNVETERESPFIVMQFVSGESLQARIDRTGPLQLCEILRVGMQVADGLSAAHQQGLVHRDIKPSNILLEEDVDRALISDFGLARAADDASLTRTGFHPGTPQYMSPEQASGQIVDARSDLFSLGSMLYTMCTGRPPFRAESSLSVMRRITESEPTPIQEFNPNIPEWMSAVITKLMTKSADQRFSSAAEVRELLEALLSHVQQPLSSSLPTLPWLLSPEAAPKTSKSKGRWLNMKTLVLGNSLVIGCVAFLMWSHDPAVYIRQLLTVVQSREADKEVLGHGYTRQGDFIYFNEQRIDQAGREDFDRFAKSTNLKLTPCAGVEAASFKALSEEYTKDKNKVYYKWISNERFWVVELPLADAQSFEVISSNLARDANSVWWYGEALPGVDPKTVEIVNPGFVWKDAKSVWYQREKMLGVDAKTFRHLDQAFYRDANRVYWSTTPLEGVDLDTFRTFGDDSPYAADRRSVWKGNTKITGFDAATFQAIHQSVNKDKHAVYAGEHVIENADSKSFLKLADLDTSLSALLADEHQYYVFLPYYGDVYQVTSTANSLNVKRSIWPPGIKQKHPVAIATAELGEAGWKNLNIAADPAINRVALKDRETHLLKLFTPQFTKAWEIIRERKIQNSSVAQMTPAEPLLQEDKPEKAKQSSEGWRSNIVAFDTYLGELVGKARVPDKSSLEKRVTSVPGSEETNSEVLPITDGAGGFVDLAPAEDSVQFQVNEALKGQKVKWEFKLAHDAATSFIGVAQLQPKVATDVNASSFLAAIVIKTATQCDFKAGDIVTLEGTIGDAAENRGLAGLLAPVGPVAIYHLDSTTHPVFWLGLKDVTISGPTRKTVPLRQPTPEITAFAKDLLRACMVYDEKKLNQLYASEVQLLPDNRLFSFGLEVPGMMTEYGVPVKRDEMLVALKKQAARDPLPSFVVGMMVSSFRIEQVDVAVGDYATVPNQPSESLFRSLRFKIEENDVLLKVSVPGAFRFVQLRKIKEQWQVIAEY